MPPCGNFGLACMPFENNTPPLSGKNLNSNEQCPDRDEIKLYGLNGDCCKDTEAGENKEKSSNNDDPISVLPLLNILQGQAAWTEFRGGLIQLLR